MQLRQLGLIAAITAALGSQVAYAQRMNAINANQTVTGRFTDSSPKESGGNAPYALYRYRGTAGERIRITMESGDFDSFLRAGASNTAPDCEPSCRTNDDGGDGLNSRLTYTVPAGGEVQIRATALGSDVSGSYRLRVEPLPPAAPERPQPLAIGRTVQGQLTSSSSVNDENGAPYDVWTIQGTPGQKLVLRMESEDFDTVLRYGRQGSEGFVETANDDDGGRGNNSRLRITLDEQGRGVVHATSFAPEAVGRYSLQLQEPPVPGPLREQEVEVGHSLRGKLETGDNVQVEDEALFDVYRIKGRPGQRVAVQLNSNDFDALLRWGVFKGGEFIEDSRDDDGGGGTNARLVVTLDAEGEARLLVSGLGEGEEGAYTLSLTHAAH